MSKVTRRQFVGTVAAGAAASATGFRIKSAKADVEPNDRIRIGVIGYGSRGTGNLAEFLRNPQVECAAVCDVDAGHLAKGVAHVESQRGNKADGVQDFRRVIDRGDIDAVVVSTPDHWHALPAVFACQTGKDVYLEKPFARTIDEGRAILEASRQHNRIVQMGTQWRSGAHYADAVGVVQSGKLGTIRSIRGWCYKTWRIDPKPDAPVPGGVDYDQWLGPSPERPFNPNRFHRDFRWYWDYAGGLMTDLGVHVLNVCQWATGLEWPLRVASVGGMSLFDGHIETPDTQTTIYEFPGYILTWEHHLNGRLGPHPSTDGVWFGGTKGALVVTKEGWEVIPDPATASELEPEEHGGSTDGRPAHIKNFLDCMDSREQPVSNAEVGHHVTAIAHLGNLAYRTGAEVLWDPEHERITNNPEADALVGEPYRPPWTLPYARQA